MENNFVLYHHPCSDGLLSAYAAYRKLGGTVTYIGVQYGQYTRPEDFERFRDATVFILDFSFKLDLFNELTSIAKRVILLDHHKTAFEELGELVDTTPVDQMIQLGSTLMRVQAIQIERHLANHFTAMFEGFRIPISNCTSGHASEVGNELALLSPFSATYQDISDKRIVSLRSSKEGVDVSLIAKKYGGGGHKNAAGFELPHGQVFWEVENV